MWNYLFFIWSQISISFVINFLSEKKLTLTNAVFCYLQYFFTFAEGGVAFNDCCILVTKSLVTRRKIQLLLITVNQSLEIWLTTYCKNHLLILAKLVRSLLKKLLFIQSKNYSLQNSLLKHRKNHPLLFNMKFNLDYTKFQTDQFLTDM